jgi:hypothetical protein
MSITLILFLIYFLGGIFVAYKAYSYCQKRKNGHDRYPVLKNEAGEFINLDMLGFKFSVILCLLIVNFSILILVINKLYFN